MGTLWVWSIYFPYTCVFKDRSVENVEDFSMNVFYTNGYHWIFLNPMCIIPISTRLWSSLCTSTYRPVFLIAPRHPLYWTGYNLFSCSSTERHFGCVCGKGNTLTGSMISLV